jgi:hypothetical protein
MARHPQRTDPHTRRQGRPFLRFLPSITCCFGRDLPASERILSTICPATRNPAGPGAQAMEIHAQDSFDSVLVRLLGWIRWWTCLPFAWGSYHVLHQLARQPEVIVMSPSQIGPALPGLLLLGAAECLQYLVPALCILAVPLARTLRQALQEGRPWG